MGQPAEPMRHDHMRARAEVKLAALRNKAARLTAKLAATEEEILFLTSVIGLTKGDKGNTGVA